MQPKIIAEISGNHGGDLDNCLRLIDEAKKLRVDYIKFQCYTPVDLAQKRKDRFPGINLVELYTRMGTPKIWWPQLIEHIGDYPWGVSVFSESNLSFMYKFSPAFLKISSYELTDTNLIRACSTRMGTSLIISVGTSASEADVLNALNACRGPAPSFLLATHYWDAPEDWNSPKLAITAEIDRYRWLSKILPPWCEIGLSDHMPPDRHAMAIYASAKNAVAIERHLCLPDVHTDDDPFSSTPDQFRIYMDKIKRFAGKGIRNAQDVTVTTSC